MVALSRKIGNPPLRVDNSIHSECPYLIADAVFYHTKATSALKRAATFETVLRDPDQGYG